MNYPELSTYRKLYERYTAQAGRPVEELVDLAGELQGKQVLDLCGGGGEISLLCAERGAEVTLVDASREMLDVQAMDKADVVLKVMDVPRFLRITANRYDGAFCRQAVNYWLDERHAAEMAHNLYSQGFFIFNTFSEAPSEKPSVKQYGDTTEISYLVGDTVHHLQVREGYAPHCTSFRWIPPEEYERILSPYFEFEVKKEGRTAIYVCRKKG